MSNKWKKYCVHEIYTEHCNCCGNPQTRTITPEIRALFYIANMPKTHDTWEIAKEAPEKAVWILEYMQGENQCIKEHFGKE